MEIENNKKTNLPYFKKESKIVLEILEWPSLKIVYTFDAVPLLPIINKNRKSRSIFWSNFDATTFPKNSVFLALVKYFYFNFFTFFFI